MGAHQHVYTSGCALRITCRESLVRCRSRTEMEVRVKLMEAGSSGSDSNSNFGQIVYINDDRYAGSLLSVGYVSSQCISLKVNHV